MNATVNRQVLLVEKPVGKLGPEHFKLSEGAIPEPKDGEALLRTRYISLDAANRAWMHGATYRAAVEANTVMAGGGIAEVVSSKSPSLAPGDIVFGDTGWQDYAAVPAKHLSKQPKIEPMTHLLSVYGIAGLTAYFGLLDVGQPRPGDTVVVSTAAGAVGSAVGQIAKITGCRTVGIAGGPAKVAQCRELFGYDAAIDYKSDDLASALAASCPRGVDVYFDNTGGEISDTVLRHLAVGARVVICGTASVSSWDPWPNGPRAERHLLVKRARMQGFVIFDYAPRFEEALARLAQWIRDGRLRYSEDVLEGIEQAPGAIAGLYRGENTGKRLIKIR